MGRLLPRPAPKAGTTVTTVIPTDTTDGEDTTEDITDILTDTGGREMLRPNNNLAQPLLLQLTLKPRPVPKAGTTVTMAIPTDITDTEDTMEVIMDIPTDTGGREALKTLIPVPLLNLKVSKSVKLRLKLALNPGIMVTTAIPTDTTAGEVTTEDTMDIPTDTGGNK